MTDDIYHRRQWTNWSLVPDPRGPNYKPIKKPHTSVKTGQAQWVTYLEACGVSDRVGLVLTDSDDYWLIDIDECLQPDGQWSPLARDVCQRFSGCYVEVSQSGTGLHLVGRGPVPDHRCKSLTAGIELYHHKRLACWTGFGATGDPECMAPEGALQWLVEGYFKPKVFAEAAVVDDADLPPIDDRIRRARKYLSKIPGAVSGEDGHGQTLKAALAVVKGFCLDSESALELMQEWNDTCEPIWSDEELMHKIIDAGESTQVSRGYLLKPVVGGVGDGPREGHQYLDTTAQVEHFKGCVYSVEDDRVFVPSGMLLDHGRFRRLYGGYLFAMDSSGQRTTKSAWEAFTESQSNNLNWVTGICFKPELEPGAIVAIHGRNYVNTYVPLAVDSVAGDASRFVGHVKRLLPVGDDSEILLTYMASLIQNPGVKFQWAPLVQGAPGNGKTLLMEVMCEAIGPAYSHLPNPSDVGNKFTGWLRGKIFAGIEEFHTRGRADIAEAVKSLITNRRLEIQGKGDNQYTGENRANFIMTCNPKDAAITSIDDRRLAILCCAQQSYADIIAQGMDSEYFIGLYGWLRGGGFAVVTHYLQNRELDVRYDPAAGCQRRPETSSTSEVIGLSMGGAEQEIAEAIAEGVIGFRGGWVSSMAVSRLFSEKGKKMTHLKKAEAIRKLGYVPHSALKDGRTPKSVGVDGGKTRLYIKPDSPLGQLLGDDVANSYQNTQKTP